MVTKSIKAAANGKKAVANGKAYAQEPKGILIAIGGKENKGEDLQNNHPANENFIPFEILERFCQELQGEQPLVAILPTASTVPQEAAQEYIKVFKKLKQKNVKVVSILCREDAAKPENLEILANAAGVIFTGGDQLRITAILGGTEALQILKRRYLEEPIVIAGTSAGAAAMSTTMIYEGQSGSEFLKGEVRITTGLEFFRDVALDTHFIARGRMIRMAHMLATNPGCMGIGLEEDTGIIVRKGTEVEVIGSGLIVLMDARCCTSTNIHVVDTGQPITLRNIKVDLLGKGETFAIPDFII